MTASFLLVAAVLLLLPIAFVFPALLKRRRDADSVDTTNDASSDPAVRNLAILREQLAELEKEHAQGLLDERGFTEAREDIERRLIEENALVGVAIDTKNATQQTGAQKNDTRNSPFAAALLLLLLVIGGFSSYLLLGTPAALNAENLAAPDPNAAFAAPDMSAIEAMASRLEAQLKENPKNEDGWLMLAAAYKTLNRPADAANAYAKAENRLATNAELLVDYAESLTLAAMPKQPGDKPAAFQGKPRRLLKQALKLDPGHAKALFLAGAAAFEANDKLEAAGYWEKLLPAVEPGSELHELLSANIARIRAEKSGQAKTKK